MDSRVRLSYGRQQNIHLSRFTLYRNIIIIIIIIIIAFLGANRAAGERSVAVV